MIPAIGLADPWPAHPGECARLIREQSWADGAAGRFDPWPPALRSALDLSLPSQAQVVMFWGPDFLAFYNDSYAPTIGAKHPHAMGRPASQGWAELWDDLGPLLRGVLETGRTTAAQDRPFRIDRHGYMEEVFFDISYSPIPDGQGGVGGVLCIVKETTTQVLALRALEASRQSLREASERIELALNAGAVIGTWVWDIRNDRVVADDRFARTFMLEARALREGLPLAQVKQAIHPEDLPAVDAAIAEAMARGGPYSAEYRVRQPGGHWRWLEANGHVELDDERRPLRFPGVLIDIHRRKLAEAARQADLQALRQVEGELKASLEHLRMAQAAGGIGVFLLDIASQELTVSHEFCRLFGLPEATRVHAHVVEALVEAGDVSDRASRLDASAPLRVEYRIRTADTGQARWLARSAEFVRGADGRPVAMRGVVQDISPQKEVEATLARRVEQRTRELKDAEDRLRQSHKMEALGQLTGGIAHDFNNLLQSITGSLEVLRRRLKLGRTDDADRYLQTAVQAAHRAAALVHRLLAFARRQLLDARAVDLHALVLSMEDMLRRTLGENIVLQMEAAPATWPAYCDENQLESAILNLVINARDAMPGGGRLLICTANASLDAAAARQFEGLEPGDYATVTVTDNGAGMAEEVLAKVFDPFFTTKPIGQGTGLGLSMIYGFARQSRGHVSLRSRPGDGTTATLYLPRHRGDAAAAPAQEPLAEAPAGGSGTVLLVEDDAGVRSLVLELLVDLGYSVREALNADAGLVQLQAPGRIDLLISDVGLPGMNGRQFAELARRERPGLPVLLMTGYAAAAASRADLTADGMEMIAKPFPMGELARKVQAMLAARA